jgi:hypothetical protein
MAGVSPDHCWRATLGLADAATLAAAPLAREMRMAKIPVQYSCWTSRQFVGMRTP